MVDLRWSFFLISDVLLEAKLDLSGATFPHFTYLDKFLLFKVLLLYSLLHNFVLLAFQLLILGAP